MHKKYNFNTVSVLFTINIKTLFNNCFKSTNFIINQIMKKNNMLKLMGIGVFALALLTFSGCSEDLIDTAIDSEGPTLKSGTLTAEVTRSGSTWTTKNGGTTVYTGTDMFAAVNAGIGSLPAGRTSKGTVNIKNSGESGSSGGAVKAINMQSNTILNFNGCTINGNSGDDLIVPIQADRKSNIEVRNIKVTGRVRYGIWFKGCTNMIIDGVTMQLSGSGSHELGIRVDHSTAATKNLTIKGTVNISGGKGHGIETYGLDGFNIGNVTVNNTSDGCGVLLNQSKNGTVGTVTGNYNCRGGGYATFRVANSNGPNVTCAKVYSRNSGRGFFSVTGSNGTTVTTVDIASNTSHGIFLEDASNTKVNGGSVSGCNPNVQHVRTTSCTTKVNGQTYTAANGKW